MAKQANSGPPHTVHQRPKVIYVMGAGRSGSTILGVTLGNCTGVLHAGELDAWLRRAGVPNFGGSERTRFWERVHKEVGGDDLFGDEAWRHLEHSLALFRIRHWRTRRKLRQRYLQIAESLYRAIGDVADVSHVVDTSHYPLRVRELRRLAGIDIYLVYLVRDPQRVVASFNRKDVAQDPKATFATNLYLWLTHLLSAFTFLGHPSERRLFLRYEDFATDPSGALHDILECAGVSGAGPDLSALSTGVPFQGNRLLRSPVISFQGDASDAPSRSGITALLQLPWRVVFSYLRPAATGSSNGPEITQAPRPQALVDRD
jgi:hypothetical protein